MYFRSAASLTSPSFSLHTNGDRECFCASGLKSRNCIRPFSEKSQRLNWSRVSNTVSVNISKRPSFCSFLAVATACFLPKQLRWPAMCRQIAQNASSFSAIYLEALCPLPVDAHTTADSLRFCDPHLPFFLKPSWGNLLVEKPISRQSRLQNTQIASNCAERMESPSLCSDNENDSLSSSEKLWEEGCSPEQDGEIFMEIDAEERLAKRRKLSHENDSEKRMMKAVSLEYAAEVYTNCLRAEMQFAASPTYMLRQSDINPRMRAIVIDWLVEVHLKFKLARETLYLTVQLFDRFLQRKTVKRQKLQLVGCTAMLIASKYEEIFAPEIRDFVYISDNSFNEAEIVAMEMLMLQTFQFRISTPSVHNFLTRLLKVEHTDWATTQLAHFYSESMLQEYSMLGFRCSLIAAAALALARKTTGKLIWNKVLQTHSCYAEEDIRPCLQQMISLMKPENGSGKLSNLTAVRCKFSAEKLGRVSVDFEVPTSL